GVQTCALPILLAIMPMPQASCSCLGSYSPWAAGRPLGGTAAGERVGVWHAPAWLVTMSCHPCAVANLLADYTTPATAGPNLRTHRRRGSCAGTARFIAMSVPWEAALHPNGRSFGL